MTKHPLNLGKGDITDRYDLVWENEYLTYDPQYRSVSIGRANSYAVFYVVYYDDFPSNKLTMSTMVITRRGLFKRVGAGEYIEGIGYLSAFEEFYPYRMSSYTYGTTYYRDIIMYREIRSDPSGTYYYDRFKFSPLYNAYGVAVDESTLEQKHLVPYRIYGIR